MSKIFSDYSEIYDLLYEDKPYGEEARFVSDLIARFSPADGGRRILDLACGTGRHCFELEKMGYVVEGSDISSEMVRMAEQAARQRGSRAVFHNFSFQNAPRLGKTFDVVISMFSAIDYLVENSEVVLALKNIASLLPPGGLFIFDYWNGNAVVRDFSPVRVMKKEKDNREVIRISRTTLDKVRQVAHVNFQFLYLEGGVKKGEFSEDHHVRYFFFREIEALLEQCGFELLYRSGFMAQALCEDDWNIAVVARKKGG